MLLHYNDKILGLTNYMNSENDQHEQLIKKFKDDMEELQTENGKLKSYLAAAVAQIETQK